MKIDFLNGNIINTNKVNFHDYIFRELKFEYSKKRINVSLLNPALGNEIITINYFNVLGFDMISCDFWGKSLHVLDWEFAKGEERLLTNKLLEEKNKNHYENSRLDEVANYVETVMTFSSGDLLTILCEYIELQMNESEIDLKS